jgi:hypothetical protein
MPAKNSRKFMKENEGRTPREVLNASARRHAEKLDAMGELLWAQRNDAEKSHATGWFFWFRDFFAVHPVIYSGLAACWIAIAFLGWDGQADKPAPGTGQSAWALFRTVPASDLNALADFAAVEIPDAVPAAPRPHSSRARFMENA